MRLVEVVRGRGTDPEAVQRLVDLARAWGKVPVTCTSTPGFVVNRVARPFYGEAFRLLRVHRPRARHDSTRCCARRAGSRWVRWSSPT